MFTAANLPAALAAKAPTEALPIVFMTGADPVKSGLVASLARPGGNITGVTVLSGELELKRLALLHELVSAATTMAYLTNPANPGSSKEMTEAASRLGVRLLILNAANPSEIERAFATLTEQRAGALLVGPDVFFLAQRAQIVALAARYRVPAFYWLREFVEAGGLTSYAGRQGDPLILADAYVGRILNGAKPGDLPVQQPARYEFAINLKTAKAIGHTIPPNLLAVADEVIE
jgi:putative tryptophan/tyrosine transport system substrate-binding protein